VDRIRIAHVINSAGLGGVPEAAYHLLRALPAERYDRRLYVLRRPPGDHESRAARLGRFDAAGVPVSYPSEEIGHLDLVAALGAWLRAERIAILHTHSYRPNRFARLAGAVARMGGLRVVAHYHNQYDDKWARGDSLAVERMLAPHTDAMVACSASVRDHVAERVGVVPCGITVVYNGVDLGRFAAERDPAAARAALGLPHGAPLVGLVGRLCAQKGQEDLIRAAPAILRRHPGVRFVLAGEADDPATERALRALAADLGVAEAFHFAGFVQDVAALYAALDLVVAPSRWEGFGLALAEAMAAGRPIVAARAGAIPEVVAEGETALLTAPADPGALAEAVATLLSAPAQMADLGRRGRLWAARFSWERSGAALDALYQRLIAEAA
jgi:glycosyltransferase involved in cell wall biosynthesis